MASLISQTVPDPRNNRAPDNGAAPSNSAPAHSAPTLPRWKGAINDFLDGLSGEASEPADATEETVDHNINFRQVADDFKRRVEATQFTGTTEVDLVFTLEDAGGHVLSPQRVPLVPKVSLSGIPDAREGAVATLKRTVLDNIESLVPANSQNLIGFRGIPVPVRVTGLSLDIRDDAAQ